MNLYIETDSNGNPINHPAFEDNLLQAFGSIPSHWEPFVRVEMPIPTVYQVLDNTEPTYQKINGVWTDVWALRDMTDAEKTAKQQAVQTAWATRDQASNWSAWTFDEPTCTFVPPIPRPTDGQGYFWQGTTNTWQVRPPYPTDGKSYKLDFSAGTWVEVTT
jgi:hypothetical protein